MKRIYTTFLIAFSVGLFTLGMYTYFSGGISAQAANALSSDSSLSSQNGTTPAQDFSSSTTDSRIAVDTAFLATLTSLTKIRIDTSIFTNEAFKRLQDNTVNLEPAVTGRENPFAPIAGMTIDTTVAQAPIITNDPVQVTNKTAVLSGTIKSTAGVIATYFEYGPTPTLGKVTSASNPSLIGTFIMSITKLTPQTTYFYRSVAKTKGAPLYGEVVSFTTN